MIYNFISFQLCWFGLVYWGDSFIPIAICLILTHLWRHAFIPQEVKLMLSVFTLGIALDSMLSLAGVFSFESPLLIPLWLCVLWGCFAATLLHSLKVLQRSIVMQAVAGAIFAPLSYIAGHQFNAVAFGYSTVTTYFILSIIWGPLLVLFFKLAHAFSEVNANDT